MSSDSIGDRADRIGADSDDGIADLPVICQVCGFDDASCICTDELEEPKCLYCEQPYQPEGGIDVGYCSPLCQDRARGV
jgi:hypothetical protein